MLAERATRAFWPVWTVLFLAVAPLLMGWQQWLPVEVVWGWGVLAILGVCSTLYLGLRRFALPTRAEALARIDARLPGRPIAAIADRQAIGAADADSRAVWDAHLARMTARTKDARAQAPDLRVADRDPFGLRFVALLFFVTALLFGSLWRVALPVEAAVGPGAVVASGPTWEGWIKPPTYTGLPTLYLADIPPGELAIMPGSQITLRLYGDAGSLIVAESVSGRTGDVGSAAHPAQVFEVTQAGRLAINGEGGAAWEVSLLPDLPPTVELVGEIETDALGEMAQPFKATDDYGVTAGTATIALQLADVTRAHGLTMDPDPREPLVIDLPMPFSGERTEITERLIDNLSEHPFANLPVTLTLSVTDAAGQQAQSEPLTLNLPGRRFFQPVARAVIELRRDLLWSRANAPRVVQLLRAVSYRPEGLFTSQTIYLRLRFTQRRLATLLEAGPLSVEAQDEIATSLWDLALLLEEGTLADARERLRRAQERLSEAMRNGASPEEIAELMNELREATDDYMDMLAQNAEPAESGIDEAPSAEDQGQTVTDDQIQALMDEIQRLMEEGRMAEAEELMEQLNALMENMTMTMTQGGEGRRRPGEQAMEDLGETLREQQELSDDAFRDLQEQFNGGPGQEPQGQEPGEQPGQQPGEQPRDQPGQQPGEGEPGQGDQPGQQPGEGGNQPGGAPQGQSGNDPAGTLAERQDGLRDELARQRGNLPGLTGDEAAAAREALERAEQAMDNAEQALRDGNLAEAINNQALAMDMLREGLRDLSQALAENDPNREPGDDIAAGEGEGRTEPARRDPLGRQLGEAGDFGTDQNLLGGADIYRRAEELLQELRRRAGEQTRPSEERDYLRRLLERF